MWVGGGEVVARICFDLERRGETPRRTGANKPSPNNREETETDPVRAGERV